MRSTRTIHIVQAHAEGEVGDVIVGGVLDAPRHCKTIFEKLQHFQQPEQDKLRNLLLNEPRGRSSMNTNLILPPCNPDAAAGFLIMESDEWAPMSGSNTICVATVLLETGMVPMIEPITQVSLDTATGLVNVRAECEAGKCRTVQLQNVPSFVWALDQEVSVPGLEKPVRVDIAWGGMWFALADAGSCGLKIENLCGRRLVELGQRMKAAVRERYQPVHPENPEIRGVTNFAWTEPVSQEAGSKAATNAVVVSPGRFDRSPCGTGSCARLAVMHARGEIAEGEDFVHRSIIGSEFTCRIEETTKVGEFKAIVPSIKGRGWITGTKQVLLDPEDPFPEGFRVGDQWHMPA